LVKFDLITSICHLGRGGRGGRGRGGRGGRGAGRGGRGGKDEKEWIPVTKLGRLVKVSTVIKSIFIVADLEAKLCSKADLHYSEYRSNLVHFESQKNISIF
jgi:hypothetical protein